MCVVSSLPPKLSMGYIVEHHTRAELTEVQQRGKKEVDLEKEGMCRCFQMSMCEATSSAAALGSQ